MATRIQLRGDTSGNWSSTNPTLALAEVGIETNTRRLKIGDGSTAWNGLDYFDADAVPYDDSAASITAATVQAAIDTLAGLLDGRVTAHNALDARVSSVEGTAIFNNGDQTIGGNKTFSASPIVPTPDAAGEATPKSYVDDRSDTAVGDARATSVQKAGDTMTGRLILDAFREKTVAVDGTGTVTLAPVDGTVHRITTSASFTLALGAAANGDSLSVRIYKTAAGHTVTLPAINWLNQEYPDLSEAGHHWLSFWYEAGAWWGAHAGRFATPA